MVNIQKISHSLEQFQYLMAQNYYYRSLGMKPNSSVSQIYTNYINLFDIATINKVFSVAKNEDRALFNLYKALVKEYLSFNYQFYENKISRITDDITFNLNQSDISLKKAKILIRESKDRNLRKELFDKMDEVVEQKFNSIYIELYGKMEECAMELGYSNYIDLCYCFHNIDSNDLTNELLKLFDFTRETYLRLLSEVAHREINVAENEIGRYDLPILWRMDSLENFFIDIYPEGLMKMITSHLGIEGLFENITIVKKDFIENTRAFCYPIRIPEKIIVNIGIRNSPQDFMCMFHEIGHALHLSSIPKNKSVIKRAWGDHSVSEAYAYLFERILSNSAYVKKYLKTSNHKKYFDLLNLKRLFSLRQYIARILWEIKICSSTDPNYQISLWAEYMTSATGVKQTGYMAFSQRELLLKPIMYIKSWMLESQLRMYLVNNYGEMWFENIRAGEFLKYLWIQKDWNNIDSISKALGFAKLDSQCLLNELKEIRS